jgi:hypothetical protein
MANVKISQLPSLSTMTNVAQIPVVAGGTTYQITGTNLQNYFTGAYGNANVVANLAALGTNPVSTAGNVTGGNVLAPGAVIATLLTGGNLQVTGGVSSSTMTAVGNITGGNLDAVNLVINSISSDDSTFVTIEDGLNVTGPISGLGSSKLDFTTYGANTAYLTTTSDDTTALFMGSVTAELYANTDVSIRANTGGTAQTWTFNSNGTLSAPGNVSAVGNIAGNYFVGNGSQLTGISAVANTGNVTFNDQIVLGTGTNDGGGGLYLAPGNASIANSAVQYLRVRGGDVPTHIHLDTGNNDYYDQYFGDDAQYVKLANIGNVVIGAANVSSSAQWSFDPNGTLIVPAANGVPGQISTATTQASEKGFDLRITAGNTDGCSVPGGDVYLSAGVGYNGISHGGGNVNIVTGDRYGNVTGNIWNFGSTGALTLPLGGVKIKDTVGNSVAFGLNAGFSLQGIEAVAIGSYAGNNRQGNNSVAIGNSAGAGGSVSTNYVSGAESPSTTLVVVSTTGIGPGMIISGTGFFGNITVVTVTNSTTLEISASAGFTPSGTLTFTGNQGANAVAIGQSAGSTNQGTGAVAIGARAGLTNQGNNSIILNATGANLDQTTANTFTVAPVRNDVANTAQVMFYNATSKEITYGNTISVAGNITGGNLTVGSGTITGGNVNGANFNGNVAFGTGTVGGSGNITGGNITTGGLISATGNVSGNYFIGNGAALTGIAASVPGQTILPTIQTITIAATSNPFALAGGEGGANVTVANTIPVTEYGVIITSGTSSQKYATGALGSIPGTVPLTFTTGLNNLPFTVFAYVTSNAGTYYSDSATGTSGICLLAGTQIALSDGTRKAIEHITYTDKMLSWDFDRGCYAETTAMWIKRGETGSQYNLLTFSDGTTLRTFDQHRIFNKQAGAFTYPMTSATPIGTVTVNEHGQEIILTNKQVIPDTIEYYNVITDYHMNLFSDGVLTSCRFNNIYPITDMKFVKDGRTLRTRAEFENVPDRFFHGLRLAEQTTDVETVEWYVNRLLSTEVSTESELAV